MVMDGARAVVLAGLCAVIVTGHVNIWLVLVAMFLVGLAEVFADTTTEHAMPMLVDKRDLGIANAGSWPASSPPTSWWDRRRRVPFAAGMVAAVPDQTVCVGLGVRAGLADRDAEGRGARARRDPRPTGHRRGRAVAGRQRPVPTLALVIVAFNVTWAAPWAVLVLGP